jgi:glycosyltransferase involved in cell wall biosynthesis
MKILWVKSDFLHPTDRGGQIRTLETLRRLHRRNEIHYVAYNNPSEPEGLARSSEYCSFVYPVERPIPKRGSVGFFAQALANAFSDLPLAVGRYRSAAMKARIASLQSEIKFDSVVCDFLSVAPNFADLRRIVLFQHNMETMIWRRHAEHASSALRRAYFRLQARRMFEVEKRICQSVAHVIAVSQGDADRMKSLFGVDRISSVSTGVDLDYFRRPLTAQQARFDLVFVGAMDWLPNIDGVRFFVHEILPIIRRSRPSCSVVLAGRSPVPEIRAIAETDPLISVTGTVPDIRPYLWESAVSIVPLRIGGGTRLKIYEAMAAGTPVVSTSIGAEGLSVSDGREILLADRPEAFASRCLALLNARDLAASQAGAAFRLVQSRFSWDEVARSFEEILISCRSGGGAST